MATYAMPSPGLQRGTYAKRLCNLCCLGAPKRGDKSKWRYNPCHLTRTTCTPFMSTHKNPCLRQTRVFLFGGGTCGAQGWKRLPQRLFCVRTLVGACRKLSTRQHRKAFFAVRPLSFCSQMLLLPVGVPPMPVLGMGGGGGSAQSMSRFFVSAWALLCPFPCVTYMQASPTGRRIV